MSLKKTIFFLTVSALAAAAVIGFTAIRTANAQTPTDEPEAETSEEPSTTNRETKRFLREGLPFGIGLETDREDLAEALGIPVEELEAATESAYEAGLTQAVEEGLITQRQMDALLEGDRAFPFGSRWKAWLTENGIDFQALLADALGITAAELQAAIDQAFFARIDEAVENGRIPEEQGELLKGRYALSRSEAFQSSMQSAFESALDQAVADGVITQEQADLLRERYGDLWARGLGGGFDEGFIGPGLIMQSIFGDGVIEDRIFEFDLLEPGISLPGDHEGFFLRPGSEGRGSGWFGGAFQGSEELPADMGALDG